VTHLTAKETNEIVKQTDVTAKETHLKVTRPIGNCQKDIHENLKEIYVSYYCILCKRDLCKFNTDVLRKDGHLIYA